MDEPVSWIMGSSRSGSTWLLRMLSELDGVAGIDDPHIGHHLGPWRPISLAWAAAADPPELQVLPDVKAGKPGYFFNQRYEQVWRPALAELVAARFAAEAEEQVPGRRQAVVVKEPGSQVAALLLSLFDDARLLFLVRDGRDVVDSWIDAYREGTWAIPEGAFAADPGCRLSLVRWFSTVWAYRTRAVRAAYEAQEPERRLLIRYESLLDDPVGVLESICRVAAIDASRADLRAAADAHRFSKLSAEQVGEGRERRQASPGGWKENLDAAEQAAMDEIMGDELERCGYPRSVAAPVPSVAA